MTPELWMAVAGGLLIGIAAVISLSLSGRIAGISGIFWGALTGATPRAWRWLFVLGLVLGGATAHTLLEVPLPESSHLSPALALAGGLLVGLGTRMGNGCTSGHGVCGIGLNSRRSIVATATFMLSGIATVFVMRHVLGGGL